MTLKAAICKALLLGNKLNIRNGLLDYGITNVPREIGRSVERAFHVKCQKTQMSGTARLGWPCVWVDYRLLPTPENMQGIREMVKYILKTEGDPKTQKQLQEQNLLKKYL